MDASVSQVPEQANRIGEPHGAYRAAKPCGRSLRHGLRRTGLSRLAKILGEKITYERTLSSCSRCLQARDPLAGGALLHPEAMARGRR